MFSMVLSVFACSMTHVGSEGVPTDLTQVCLGRSMKISPALGSSCSQALRALLKWHGRSHSLLYRPFRCFHPCNVERESEKEGEKRER